MNIKLSLFLFSGMFLATSMLPSFAQWGNGSKRFDRLHPRRHEVLRRTNNIDRSLYKDKGHLGGNFNNLKQQDKSIRQQEQADAKANGGYITPQQKQQFNQEENSLRQQVNQDYNPR